MVIDCRRLSVAFSPLASILVLLVATVGASQISPIKAENARTYATEFPLEENPISEAGVWQRLARLGQVRTFVIALSAPRPDLVDLMIHMPTCPDSGLIRWRKRQCARIRLSEAIRLPARSGGD